MLTPSFFSPLRFTCKSPENKSGGTRTRTGGEILELWTPSAGRWSNYSAALIQHFPAPTVLGSYLNLTIAAGASALVLLAVTRGRLGYEHYQQEEDPDPPWPQPE